MNDQDRDIMLRMIYLVGRLEILDEIRDRRWAKQREKDLRMLGKRKWERRSHDGARRRKAI